MNTITPNDFTRGRTFGINGNIRKAIVFERYGDKVLRTWVGTDNDAGCSYVSDAVDVCNWLGDVDMELLKRVEGD